MPEYLSPGVYVEEVPSGPRPIQGVGTSNVGFVGLAERGPLRPRLVTSWGDYVRWFGGPVDRTVSFMPLAVRGFFDNGGQRAFVARIVGAGASPAAGLFAAPGPANDPQNFLVVRSIGPGRWGNNLLVRIQPASQADPAAVPPRDWFRISILYYRDGVPEPFVDPLDPATVADPGRRDPDELEDFDNLTFEDGRADNVVTVINAASRLVEVAWVNTGANPEFGARPQDTAFVAPQRSRVDLQTADANTVLRATARTPGVAGDALEVGVALGTAANSFRIDVLDGGAVVEAYDDLPDADPGQALGAVNAGSALIRLAWASPAPAPALPNATPGLNLQGGGHASFAALDLPTNDANTVLRLTARLAGSAAQSINVTVAVDAAAATFGITITDGALTEPFLNIPDAAPDQARTDINAGSTLVQAAWVRIGQPVPARPNDTVPVALGQGGDGTALIGGDDGAGATPVQFAGTAAAPPDERTGLAGLAVIDEVNMLVAPDEVNGNVPNSFLITNALVDQCELLRDRFAILSVPRGQGAVQAINPPRDSTYGAVYYPWIRVFDPRFQDTPLIPAVGHVAGIYARTDIQRGVHKAPANEVVRGIVNRDLGPNRKPLEYPIVKGEQDILNPRGVNVIRDFRPDGRGIRVWGARTMSSDPLWRYVNVRRLFLFVEESIDEGTQWVVFEPNDEPLWARVRQTISNFLTTVWRSGALQGLTADEAFFVHCDRTTMTQDDIDGGRLICEIGIAPVKPAEFVIFRIQQKTLGGQTS